MGVLTGGGDCSGLNAVIRAVVRSAYSLGWEAVGIQESFGGLLNISGLHRQKVLPVRNEWKAIRFPSGDQEALKSSAGSASS